MEAVKIEKDIDVQYLCSYCCEDFETKKEAKACCFTWECGWCGEEFETKKEANKCCKDT